MKKVGLSAAVAGALLAFGSGAYAADMTFPTKAPALVAPASASCASLYDFAVTACPLTWGPLTLYGTVDMGLNYSTKGTPFDPNHPTGQTYILGASGTNATNRLSGFFPGPNGLSQSNIGFKINQPIGGGWSYIQQNELAFDPYSALLANAPVSLQNAIGVAENQQLTPYDSSRWGWLAASNYLGFSSPVYGTVTFGRQNTPLNDGIVAYDPMGAAYAFSVIGYSGKTCGAGDTETCRWTTAIKYRENIGAFRLVAMIQPIGLFGGRGVGLADYNPNSGAVDGGVGGDIKIPGGGTLSLDVLGTYEKDAVNISTTFPGQVTAGGWPVTFPTGVAGALVAPAVGSGLKATISDNTSIMALAKYSFGSWGDPKPVVGKAVPPSGPTGIPLTLYAGYEWIQFANPSDPQSGFRDDGFLFNATTPGATTLSANGTTILNNAFNAACGSGAGGCEKEYFQVMWTGAKYGITKNLDIIGAYYHYIQSAYVISAPGATCNTGAATLAGSGPATNSRCGGWFDTYSVVLDWRFLPKWDLYIGTAWSAAFGSIANGDIARNNLSTTGGVRFRF